ncbi:MAG: TonB-dependent receptor [Novosphingobium sp.]
MKTSITALGVALSLAAPAFADETDSPDAYEPANSILVVGQTQAPIEIAPRGLAISLGAEQFAAVNAFNTEDLIKYAPNFFVRKRYAGDSNGVPGFRGTHSTQSARTLTMVDGFVVSNFLGNSFSFAPKWGVVGPGEIAQFDIVYGPYSSRYVGNAMGGIVNITTRDPEESEAFATVQGFVQPYRQFATHDNYRGFSGEAGIGLRQKDGPWSLRLTGRHLRNTGQPMTYLGLAPVSGVPGPVATGLIVTGAVVDPEHVSATASGTGIPGAPGNATNPYFAAQSPALITQEQVKLKVGFDDGSITAQALFAYWHNEDRQTAPDCYLRDSAGNVVCEGRVTIGTQTYTASGANLARTVRDELLAGVKVVAPLGEDTTLRVALSTYQVPRTDSFTSNGYLAGKNNAAGTLAKQGPTGWWTGDITLENKTARRELAAGMTANAYRTDQTRYNVPVWQSAAGKSFATRTFGKTRQLSVWGEARVLLDPLTITAGARYDDWRAHDGGLARLGTGPVAGKQVSNAYAARRQGSVNPSLSFEYRLGAQTRLQLSLAMATRFPTVGELFQGSLNGDGSFNPDSFDPALRPERSKDANLVIGHDFGRVKLVGSAFFQRVDDTIFSFSGFNQNRVLTSSFKNIDRTRQFGFEGIIETRDWLVAGLQADLNAAYIDSRTLRNASAPAAEGVQFPRIPKWRVNANLRYDFTGTLQGSLGMRYASRPNTDLFGLQRGDTFGFTSELSAMDVRLNWQVTDQVRLSTGIDNLTNDRAWVFHPYPQRTFLVEAGWRM